MIERLVSFLRLEAKSALCGCGEDTADKFSTLVDDLEWKVQVSRRKQKKLMLPRPKNTGNAAGYSGSIQANGRDDTDAESAVHTLQSLIDAAHSHVADAGKNGGAVVCWIHLYADAALLQALGFIVAASPTADDSIKVLNDLDRATVVAGASVEHLQWIHRLIDGVEGAAGTTPTSTQLPPATGNLEAQLEVPALSFPATRLSVESVDVGTFLEMIRDQSAAEPFIIEGAISCWPALSGPRAWRNLEYLRSAVGHHRLVPVEIGSKYTDAGWSQKLMPFGAFLDKFIYRPSQGAADCKPDAQGYLAQHNLFAQAPRLKGDVSLPDYTQVETGRRSVPEEWSSSNSGVLVNAWLGPKDTVSPLHHDKYDNLLAQVVGCKYVRLYSPAETDRLYPHAKESMLPNTSMVDVEAPDLQRFGQFSQARYLECVVRPGDLLYIPPGYWHYVRSLSTSVSLSFWF